MKILVIGGAGYIGSHVVYHYKQAGHYVAILDNFSTGHQMLAENSGADLIQNMDCRTISPTDLDYDQIVHLGSLSIVEESIRDPLRYHDNNVRSAIALLSAMAKSRCKQIIFSSSAAVYGIPRYVPIDEWHTTNPINPYGRTKLEIEWLLKDCQNIKYVALRYFNAAGASSVANLGEWHNPETHLIPLMINAYKQNITLNIYGDNHYNSIPKAHPGFAIRDFVHVDDIAEAHLLSSEYLASGGNSVILNIGTNIGYSVFEVLLQFSSLLARNNKYPIDYKICSKRIGDPPELVACNDFAKQVINWQPKKTLEDMIKSAYRWHIGEELK